MRLYFSKKDEWFDEGTEAILVTGSWMINESCRVAIFAGIRNGKPDEELCGLDEFEVIEIDS